ncbi:MAG: HEAT repeat domain-containing protein [Parachlamydiales bacterium]|nr:HEAT repeat domain-containing protein [Parachlamydiales bacterium]
MGLFKKFLIFNILVASIIFSNELDSRHILYLMHSNEIEKAFLEYQKNKSHDFEILQKMSLILLKNGAKSSDLEIQQMCMFGAGLAASSSSIDILELGLNSSVMQTQLVSLHFLSMYQDDKTDKLLTKAMGSDFLPTRLEAAYHMAKRKHPHAIGQIESLMFRLPAFLKPYFPSLFALIGTTESNKYIKKFLNDPNPDVRIETILSIANFSLDDLLPFLRKKFANATIGEKEALTYAISTLKDSSANDAIEKLAVSPVENVKISAARSLYLLGIESKKDVLIDMAKQNNLFAISNLQIVNGSEDFLYSLTKSNNKQVKFNAAISLLKRKDFRSVDPILEFLISDQNDLAFEPFFSVGRTMMYFKIVPAALHRMKDARFDPSITLSIKESILKDALELKEDDFLFIAKTIFDKNQNDLVPMLISLLENLGSEKAIELIKANSLHSKSTLIRDYCNLSLYRLKQDGPYEEYIANWIKKQNHLDIIKINISNSDKEKSKSNVSNIYTLTKEESSRLLIDMYTALASKQNEQSLSIIVDSIRKTNPKNRYALAGILIRATE